MDIISTGFIESKLQPASIAGRSSSSFGVRPGTTMHLSKAINTASRMEPMSRGPFTKTAKEVKTLIKRDNLELQHGYGYVGSPFDHPYLQWMDGLRKTHDTAMAKHAGEAKQTKEELLYQKYLGEVKSLNMVKEFLSSNKEQLS